MNGVIMKVVEKNGFLNFPESGYKLIKKGDTFEVTNYGTSNAVWVRYDSNLELGLVETPLDDREIEVFKQEIENYHSESRIRQKEIFKQFSREVGAAMEGMKNSGL